MLQDKQDVGNEELDFRIKLVPLAEYFEEK